MTASIKQPTFAGGEISPSLYARADNAIYERSLRTLRNFFSMRQGGVTGRPGTQFISSTFNGGNPVRLIPFVFNETGLGQSYCLEFGNEYIAFRQNGANILGADLSSITSFTSITQANPGVITILGNLAGSLANGSVVFITNVLGMTELNNGYFRVRNFTPGASTTFTLEDMDGVAVNTLSYGAFTGGGTIVTYFTIASPYQQSDLADLNYGQSADVMTIVNQNYAPQELRRNGPLFWQLIPATYIGTAPDVTGIAVGGGTVSAMITNYKVTAVMSNGDESVPTLIANNTVVPSTATPIVVTWTPVVGAVSYRIYKFDVGGVGATAANVFGFIGASTSASFNDPGITADYANSPPVFGPLKTAVAAGDYPAVVGYAQQRRFFSNTPLNPVGTWGSASGSPSNFNANVNPIDSDSISFSIAGEEVNAIQSLIELKFMLMLTSGSELYIQGNGNGVITPSSVNASTQSQYGASPLRPLKVGDLVIFNQALGSAVRDFAFDFAVDGYRGNDITIFASHMFEGFQLTDWTYQRTPDSLIWVVRSDGVLLCCTYVREQQVLAWSRHDFFNGLVENVCAIPENGQYAVYLSIKREIDGETVRYIERMSSRIWLDPVNDPPVQNDPINASYLDSYLEYDGRNTGSTKMILTGKLTVVAGVNDGITFVYAPTIVTYFAIVPPGEYSPNELSAAIALAMDTAFAGSYTSVAQVVLNPALFTAPGDPPGYLAIKISTITADTTTLILSAVSDPINFSRSILPMLGFGDGSVYQTFSFDFTGSVFGFVTPMQYTAFSETDTAYQQKLNLMSSVAYFTAAMVGQQIFFQDEQFVQTKGAKGQATRLTIQAYIDSTNVTVTPDGIVPEDFRNLYGYPGITNWSHAVQTVSGLSHLVGEEVSIWADRFVVGSPLNYHISTVYTVSADGTVTLDKPYAVIFVGLPMTQDVQTLDRETVAGESMLASRKLSSTLAMYVMNTRTLFAGSENPDTNLNNADDVVLFELNELMRGSSQVNYDQPPQLVTGQDFIIMDSEWNRNGRLFIRNVDPSPTTILAISPEGSSKSSNPGYERV